MNKKSGYIFFNKCRVDKFVEWPAALRKHLPAFSNTPIFLVGLVTIIFVFFNIQEEKGIFFLDVSSIYAQESEQSDEEIDEEIEEALEEKATEQQGRPIRPGSSGRIIIDRANLPNILVAVDMTAGFDLNANEDRSETQAVSRGSANAREVEFGFFTAIDQWALGSVLFAVHNENGQFFTELHEAFLELNRLPYNLFFKIGKFFMDVGRINGIHRHDWRFTQAPLVHYQLFDPEGVDDFGGELSVVMPWSFYQEFKVGVFNGRTFGHTHNEGIEKPHPLYTGRIKNFLPITHDLGSQFGATYMRYNIDENPGNYWQTYGLDVTVRWQSSRFYALEWTSEFWYRNTKSVIGDDTNRYGYYSFVELRAWQIWHFGFRWDHFTLVNNFDPRLNENVDKNDYGQSVWVTLRPSEFSYYRLTFERQDYYARNDNYLMLLQVDFIIGFHPPHRY